MNILFFLVPKNKVAFCKTSFSIRQALEKMDESGYNVIPVLNDEGEFVEALTSFDMLKYIKEKKDFNLYEAQRINIMEVPVARKVKCVKIDTSMADLIDLAQEQNFVPVSDDDNHFIGIIKRRSIIEYLKKCYESD